MFPPACRVNVCSVDDAIGALIESGPDVLLPIVSISVSISANSAVVRLNAPAVSVPRLIGVPALRG